MFSVIFAQLVPDCDTRDADCTQANTFADFGEVFLRLLSILIPIGGLVLFVMLIIGGFSFMTSSGDPRKAEGAKATITYAVIGIILLASAFLIVQVIANFVGVSDILNFRIYVP